MPDPTPGTGGTPGAGATPPQAGGQRPTDDDQPRGDGGGTPPAQAAGSDDDGKPSDDTTGLRSALQKEREARKEIERQMRDLQERDLPEAAKAQRRLADLEGQQATWERTRDRLSLENEVLRHATAIGFRNPDDAARLIDEDALTRDDNGRPTNVKQVLQRILTDKPYLRATAPTGGADQGARGGSAGNGAPDNDMNGWLRRQVAAKRSGGGSVSGTVTDSSG